MRNISIFVFFLSLQHICTAQNIAINNTAALPDPSAMLDVSSDIKGLLIPRVTTAQLASVSHPAKGLLIFDSSRNQLLVNTGTPLAPAWQNATAGWNLSGNSGTNPATNFLGTTDATALHFRVKNLNAATIDSALANTGIGFRVLDSLVDGSDVVALGYKALLGNTSGSQNVAVGSSAMRFNKTGNYNVSVGTLALYKNTAGGENTAVGTYGLAANTTGINNTAVGSEVMQLNTTGSHNTALGLGALYLNKTGNSNVALGINALGSVTNRSYQVAVGDSALFNSFGPANQPDLGNANTALGSKALYSNGTGSGNTAAGYQSLYNNFSGVNNTALGYKADIGAGSFSNATAIGANALITESNSVQLGDAAVLKVSTAGNVFVKTNKGIIRSADATQQKKLTTTIGLAATIPAGGTVAAPFTWPETFSGVPDAYVGGILSGTGFTDLTMTLGSLTATGGTLFFSNIRNAPVSPNFVVKVVAIGAE